MCGAPSTVRPLPGLHWSTCQACSFHGEQWNGGGRCCLRVCPLAYNITVSDERRCCSFLVACCFSHHSNTWQLSSLQLSWSPDKTHNHDNHALKIFGVNFRSKIPHHYELFLHLVINAFMLVKSPKTTRCSKTTLYSNIGNSRPDTLSEVC